MSAVTSRKTASGLVWKRRERRRRAAAERDRDLVAMLAKAHGRDGRGVVIGGELAPQVERAPHPDGNIRVRTRNAVSPRHFKLCARTTAVALGEPVRREPSELLLYFVGIPRILIHKESRNLGVFHRARRTTRQPRHAGGVRQPRPHRCRCRHRGVARALDHAHARAHHRGPIACACAQCTLRIAAGPAPEP